MWFLFGFATGYFFGRNPAQAQAVAGQIVAGGQQLLTTASGQMSTQGGTPAVTPVGGGSCPAGQILYSDGVCRMKVTGI